MFKGSQELEFSEHPSRPTLVSSDAFLTLKARANQCESLDKEYSPGTMFAVAQLTHRQQDSRLSHTVSQFRKHHCLGRTNWLACNHRGLRVDLKLSLPNNVSSKYFYQKRPPGALSMTKARPGQIAAR